VIQAHDGTLHATYSYFVSEPDGGGKSIKYVHFTKSYVEAGDPRELPHR
jgi:hypothetical protein